MNALAFVAVILTATEPDLCLFGPPAFDPLGHLPPRTDLLRFPDFNTARQQYFRYDSFLKTPDPRAPYDALLRDRDKLLREQLQIYRAAWDILDDAHLAQWNNEEECRTALRRLRDTIGLDAYERGLMPPELAEIP